MSNLKLVGLSADGRNVVFVDDDGTEFVSPADDKLRAALRGDRVRLGQLEIQMESALRPRDIQARIRAGETPESVAVLAQVSVERIMPFCVPVLAERQHMAELARRHHVRRKNAEGPAKSLDAVVAERLRSRSIDPSTTDWDSWRRDDGRWEVRAAYKSGEREHVAAFVFDAIGRYSVADDDEAKWLTGERQASKKGPQPREAGRGNDRRLSAVPAGDDLLTLSEQTFDDLLEPDDAAPDVEVEREVDAVVEHVREVGVAGPEDDEGDELTAVARAVQEIDEQAVEDADAAADDDADEHDEQEAADDSSVEVADEEPVVEGEPAPEAAPEQPRRANRRSSVPSWDEIMLGTARDER